ncbi:MAG: crotonase [Gemmatimonadales bacterium]|nr:crotonase [Gemmatimonadales bacterium]NIN12423.1 crotonase [Gemmatimonadales bacterium]NIN50799.1 crotonase [Gemmatimonadales bacterium]NIP08263.1 crotonase [Gemmatimonadales bacterium]NIR00787.1 crotonase [Gemmatimonadales bacterium]
MADQETVLVDIAPPVATLTINRPDKLNALNASVRREFVESLGLLQATDAVRVVIVTGAGDKAFVAGADIKEFEDRAAVEQFRVMKGFEIFEATDAFPKPTIAAINGFCLGGGCELAMACDIRIASDKARLGQPEVNLGILPGGGGTQRLPRLVGLGNAFKLLYTGDLIPAAEALRMGLVDEVVPHEAVRERVQELASKIAQKSPVALQLIKEAVRASVRAPLDEGIRLETTLFGLAFSSEDKEEGIKAFLEKRQPDFTGR